MGKLADILKAAVPGTWALAVLSVAGLGGIAAWQFAADSARTVLGA